MPNEDILSDEEITSYIMSIMFYNNSYQRINEGVLYDELPHVTKWDIDRIFRELKANGLIINKEPTGVYFLSDKGMRVMRKHGTYEKYLIEQEKEANRDKRNDRVDRNFKNGNILAAISVSLIAIFVQQCPSKQTKELQSLQQDIKSLSTQLDSLQHTLLPLKNKSHK